MDGTIHLRPFAGRSHAEVLDLTFGDATPDLIDGIVPRGVVITTAGLPETYKGWVCQKKAQIIAAGSGALFDCEAVAQGPVGYFWQDDCERNEAERVQLYAARHETPRELPIRWFLNEGLQLPADTERLRLTIERFGFVYVVLDSFYNIAGSVDLRDRDAGAIFAQLKTEVCDPTGCTIDVVDHMPWATETNRKRLRGYGDVFKNAAIRAGLYIDAAGSKLHVEARGNNIKGFKRTPAYWDADALELRLVDAGDHDENVEQRAAAALKWLVENAGSHPTAAIRSALGGRSTVTDKALLVLKGRDEVVDHVRGGGTWSGKPGVPCYCIATVHAGSHGIASPSQLFGTRSDEVAAGSPENEPRPTPYRGWDEVLRDEVGTSASSPSKPLLVVGDDGYLELLAAAHRNGHLTEAEAKQRWQLHKLVEAADGA